MRRHELLLASACLAALGALAACVPPVDHPAAVTSAAAPLLAQPDEKAELRATLHAGDLVEVTGTARPDGRWSGKLDGADATRAGEVVRVRRYSGEQDAFAFKQDLGAPREAPSAAWLCRRMGGTPDCAGRLRRVAMPNGVVVGYEPCGAGACRVAAWRSGRKLEAMNVEGIVDARFATMNRQEVLLATLRWKRDKMSGGSVQVLRVEPRLEKAVEVVTESAGPQGLAWRERSGRLTITQEGMRFQGLDRMTTAGEEIWHGDIDETYVLAPPPKK